jgi:hypothetical protein
MNLLDFMTEFAAKHSDGHFTIMKFTTNWRVSFGTPNEREDISEMAVAKTMEDAVRMAVAQSTCRIGRDHWMVDDDGESKCFICARSYESIALEEKLSDNNPT